jgi:hypothetical protein
MRVLRLLAAVVVLLLTGVSGPPLAASAATVDAPTFLPADQADGDRVEALSVMALPVAWSAPVPAERAVTRMDDMSDVDRLRRCGFEASKFDWLPTQAPSSCGC